MKLLLCFADEERHRRHSGDQGRRRHFSGESLRKLFTLGKSGRTPSTSDQEVDSAATKVSRSRISEEGTEDASAPPPPASLAARDIRVELHWSDVTSPPMCLFAVIFLALGFAVYFVLNVTYSDCCCVVMFSISFGTAILSFFYFFFLKLLPFSAADKGKHDCTCLFCAVLIKVN